MRHPETVQQAIAVAILATLALLLGLLFSGLSSDPSAIPTLAPRQEGLREPLPIRQANTLVRADTWLELATNVFPSPRPFFAAIIQPRAQPEQPPPDKPAPPPPPATRKIELTYQGHIEDSSGRLQAFILTTNSLLIASNGTVVVADFALQSIRVDALQLVSPRGITNSLPFNRKTLLEIPAN